MLTINNFINSRCSEIGGNTKAPWLFKYSFSSELVSSKEDSIVGEFRQGLNNPKLSPSKHRNLSVLKKEAIGWVEQTNCGLEDEVLDMTVE